MKQPTRLKSKLAVAAQVLAVALLAACTTPGILDTSGATINGSGPITVCHATGDPAAPYQLLTVSSAELEEHLGHPNDFGPAPAGG